MLNLVKNPSIGSRVVPCGQTDMTKLTVAFSQFCERVCKTFDKVKFHNLQVRAVILVFIAGL